MSNEQMSTLQSKVNNITVANYFNAYGLKTFKLIKEDNNGQIISLKINDTKYYYIKDVIGRINGIIDSSGAVINRYSYDGFGNVIDDVFSIDNNILYKGYYYDDDIGLYICGNRYYNPKIGRFIDPNDISNLDLLSGNINLYSYSNNSVSISYNAYDDEIINSSELSISSSRLILPKVPWIIDNATRIYGALVSLSACILIASYYAKYANIINAEFKLYGISKLGTSLQLSNVSFKMTGFDGFLIGLDVFIDMYDSYQRGVSTEGILAGGALTAATGVGLLYLNKGIMWATTTLGTAICPGLGTAIGFLIGIGISLFVDWQLGVLASDWIDSIAQ